METKDKAIISLQSSIDGPVRKVWKYWTTPEDIVRWNNASEDWHTPEVKNDLQTGGGFSYRMEAKDGSMGFDFAGTYDKVVLNKEIRYTLGDGRKVEIFFTEEGDQTKIIESFEAEHSNTIEVQRTGWHNILENFRKYVESAK